MKQQVASVVSALALAALAGTASAGGSKGSIGVGGEATFGNAIVNFDVGGGDDPEIDIGTIPGLSIVYDAGQFHAGGFLGFRDGADDNDGDADDTDVAIGGRFYYHIHSTAMADFGIGGSATVAFIGDRTEGLDANATAMLIEPGFQIRAFVASNVALSFAGGLSLGLVDAEGVQVTAQPTGAAGVHYYFF